ncbi:hypothetical protein LX32DRAFT_126575 [Colletotrichum zoysiae]|uniref:Uncharacterized protein n=1 Tax=Colletotrichum zoysiae TaxID=1216348 RepID=A0AAD9H7X4_9PEZI|nr:hypothetical protein LX32DRAFT_126575 [Colletotrichum zoysiae]
MSLATADLRERSWATPERIPADSRAITGPVNPTCWLPAGRTTSRMVRLFDSGNPLPDAADISLGPQRERERQRGVSDTFIQLPCPQEPRHLPLLPRHCGLPPARPLSTNPKRH